MNDKLGNAQATFGDLHRAGRPDLYVIGTNLSTGYAEIFSADQLTSTRWMSGQPISTCRTRKRNALLEQGICGAETYFAWFENSAESAVNRL